MKFVRKAADIKNVAVQTALVILQNEPISMCNSINVDIDCSHGAFYYAVNSCYSQFVDICVFYLSVCCFLATKDSYI